jgi:hypothetical protein
LVGLNKKAQLWILYFNFRKYQIALPEDIKKISPTVPKD